MIPVHAHNLDAADVVGEQAVEREFVQQVAVGLDHQLRRAAVALVQAREGVEQKLWPVQHFTAREDDAVEGNVAELREVGEAAVDLLCRQAGGTGSRIDVAVGVALIAVPRRHHLVNRLHVRSSMRRAPDPPHRRQARSILKSLATQGVNLVFW